MNQNNNYSNPRSLQNNENIAVTIQELLQQDPQYYESISKSLSTQVLSSFSHYLLQQREESKKIKAHLSQQINDMQLQLQKQRHQISQLKDYTQTLQQQCENFRNLLTSRQHENERKYIELSQSSISMRDQYQKQLRKQREYNHELTGLIKQLKYKTNEIKKLQITINKLQQENQSFKKFKQMYVNTNEQLSQTSQKLLNLKESQSYYKQLYEIQKDKCEEMQQRNDQLQYIVNNQIPKIKQMLGQGIGSNSIPRMKQSRNNEQNMQLLKQIQQNFENQFMIGSQKASDSHRNRNKQSNDANQLNDNNFQNSLDNISDNWEVKEIQASSKRKNFNHDIFDIDQKSNENGSSIKQQKSRNYSSNKIQENDPFQKINLKEGNKMMKTQQKMPIKLFSSIKQPQQQNKKKSEDKVKEQEQIIPLSVNRNAIKTHKKYEQHQHPKSQQTSPNKELKKMLPRVPKIPYIPNISSVKVQKQDTPLLSSRSERQQQKNSQIKIISTPKQSFYSPRQQLKFQSNKSSSDYGHIISPKNFQFNNTLKSKQDESLRIKLKEAQTQINKLQKQLKDIQLTKQKQINLFKQQFYSQIQKIEKLNNLIHTLEIQKLALIEENRGYKQKIEQKNLLVKQYQKIINKQEMVLQNQKVAVKQLGIRLMQVQEQKWNQVLNSNSKSRAKLKSSRKQQSVDQGIQTQKQNQVYNNSNILQTESKLYESHYIYPNEPNKIIMILKTEKQTMTQHIVMENKEVNTCKFDKQQGTQVYLETNQRQTQTQNQKQLKATDQKQTQTFIQTKQINSQTNKSEIKQKLIIYSKLINIKCKIPPKNEMFTIQNIFNVNISNIIYQKIAKLSKHKLDHYHYIPHYQKKQQNNNIKPIIQVKSIKKQPIFTQYETKSIPKLKQNKIKQFKPTTFAQQLIQQTSSIIDQVQNQQQHQQIDKILLDQFKQVKCNQIQQSQVKNMQLQEEQFQNTIYYSIDTVDILNLQADSSEINKNLRDQSKAQDKVIQNNNSNRNGKQSSRKQLDKQNQNNNKFNDITNLQLIISKQWNSLGRLRKNNQIPNLSNLKATQLSLFGIVPLNKKSSNSLRQFYVISCFLRTQNQLIPDKIVLWKQGIASLRQGKCLIMAGTRKYVNDPSDWILGNCQIIVDSQGRSIQIRRAGKKCYFMGDLQDCSWKLIKLEGSGSY